MTKAAAPNHAFPSDAEGFEFPPFLRKPEDGTRESTEWMIRRIDGKIEQLKGLCLRPHPTMLGYRAELKGQLQNNGPYRLQKCSDSAKMSLQIKSWLGQLLLIFWSLRRWSGPQTMMMGSTRI